MADIFSSLLSPLRGLGIVDVFTPTDEMGFPRELPAEPEYLQPVFRPGLQAAPSLFGNALNRPAPAPNRLPAFPLKELGSTSPPFSLPGGLRLPLPSLPGLPGRSATPPSDEDEDAYAAPPASTPPPQATPEEVARNREALAQVGDLLARKMVETYNRKLERYGQRVDAAKHKDGRTFQTYTRNQVDGPLVYAGRTSGFGPPQYNVDARYPLLGTEFEGPKLERSSDFYSSIRGREQQVIDCNKMNGISANILNGISPFNPMRGYYMARAMAEFGPKC